MNNCIDCKEIIAPESQFCPNCGVDQNKTIVSKNISTGFLITLCVLTIIGSIFTIFRALFYLMVGFDEDITIVIRSSIYLLTSIGTIIGAIQMLRKQKIGLFIYTSSQAIYLITIVFAISFYVQELGRYLGKDWAIFIAMFFIIPSGIMLSLYWLLPIRKHLK